MNENASNLRGAFSYSGSSILPLRSLCDAEQINKTWVET